MGFHWRRSPAEAGERVRIWPDSRHTRLVPALLLFRPEGAWSDLFPARAARTHMEGYVEQSLIILHSAECLTHQEPENPKNTPRSGRSAWNTTGQHHRHRQLEKDFGTREARERATDLGFRSRPSARALRTRP